MPEGTPVKAADDGVVAYSGNELKGYGNLVLIRHANGYVTAYAHASELLVKRGDTIKRGQVIAKSGQSGEVQSPQLHFEIRKGSSAGRPASIPERGVSSESDALGEPYAEPWPSQSAVRFPVCRHVTAFAERRLFPAHLARPAVPPIPA